MPEAIRHKLRALLSSLEVSYPDLSKFYELVETLEEYYTPTRYPDALQSGAPFEVYEYEDAEDALQNAELVFDYGRSIIPQN